MRHVLVAMAGLLSGCTALETRESQAWLALHAIDSIQSFHAAQQPECFKEDDGVTRSLIGEHPSDAEVIAWSVGMAGLHLGVTEVLLRNDHPKLAKAWQYVRIGVTASAIAQNHSIGIRVGSPNRPTAGNCNPPATPPPVFDLGLRPIG
jgi:hypothetical protein